MICIAKDERFSMLNVAIPMLHSYVSEPATVPKQIRQECKQVKQVKVQHISQLTIVYLQSLASYILLSLLNSYFSLAT